MQGAFTSHLKLKESEEKRENSKRPPHHGNTGINSVVTHRLNHKPIV